MVLQRLLFLFHSHADVAFVARPPCGLLFKTAWCDISLIGKIYFVKVIVICNSVKKEISVIFRKRFCPLLWCCKDNKTIVGMSC